MGQFASKKPDGKPSGFLRLRGCCMKDTLDHIAQSTEAAVSAKVAVAAGSVSSVIFGFDANVVGIVCGVAIGLIGLIYNIWATERKLKILKMHKQEDEWGS